MRVSQSQFGSILYRLVALALVLWLGGAACLFGCEIMVSAAPAVESQDTAEAESCPSSTGHDCCPKAQEGRETVSEGAAPPAPDMLNCCPLADYTAVVASSRSGISAPPAIAVSIHRTLPAPQDAVLVASPVRGLRVPDRGGTYLRCCVFLN